MQKIIVENVEVPPEAMVDYEFIPLDYTDAFRVRLFGDTDRDMTDIAYRVFGKIESYPFYVRVLLRLRDFLVRPFGLYTAGDMKEITDLSGWIGFFRIYDLSKNEIILGADDRHLDVRVSLLRNMHDDKAFLTVSTFVRLNNLLGRIYFTIIRPFHRVIVPDMIKKSMRHMRDAGYK